jgi:RNA polymerase sigma-70 factor (ECF subfamily)
LTIAVSAPCTDLGDHVHHTNVGADPADARSPVPLDVALLTRSMVNGDEAAYRTFYDAYFNRLSRYLLVVNSGDEDKVREALQAALVRVVRHIKVFPDDDEFWRWLTVLARSALSDQSRKRRRYLAFLERFTQHARVEHVTADDGQPDTRLLILLERMVAGLPDEERELVERKYSARRSVREIAEEFQTSDKAIESRLVRVRRKLREAMPANPNDARPGTIPGDWR